MVALRRRSRRRSPEPSGSLKLSTEYLEIRDPLTKPRNECNLLKIRWKMTICPKNEPNSSISIGINSLTPTSSTFVTFIRARI